MNKRINDRPGIIIDKEGLADILIWAPLAKKVSVVKEDNKNIGLEKSEEGYWTAVTGNIQPGDRYKIKIDDQEPLPDAASLNQGEGVHGFSEVTDLKFEWNEGSWDNHPLEGYIIYELHTGTFSPEGTFEGIEKKLDYLLDLGVNAIEIMPVAQFPGTRNWGYDGVYPYAVQNSYGGYRKLQELVESCHRKGIAVILDVVYNHLGPEGNYLSQFGPYFTDKYHTPWGQAINFDDEWCDGVRHYFIQNVLMWFRDFHIDALRLDAVHAIKDLSPKHILKEIKEKVDELMKETGRNHYLIVELDLNDTQYINPLNSCGYGMDAQWIDEFHHALRVTSGQEKRGYYADFDGLTHLAKSYNDAYVYDGQYSAHRHKKFGVKTDNPGHQFIVFSQNHDQVGNRMLGERTSELVSFEMCKLMAGAVLTSPFLPMLFMGEEWGAKDRFQYFVSHGDPDLIEAVRKGRKAEFAAFHAKGEAPDPQSEETFLNSKLNWEALKEEKHQSMISYYKDFLRLRKTNPVLKDLNRKNVNVQFDEDSKTLTLYRWHEKNHLLALMNFSQKEQQTTFPFRQKSEWHKLIDSADSKYGGNSLAPDQITGNTEVTLKPESIILYYNS